MTYLQMYIIITVWIFHKNKSREGIIAQQEEQKKWLLISCHILTHTHTLNTISSYPYSRTWVIHSHFCCSMASFQGCECVKSWISITGDTLWPKQKKRISMPLRIRRNYLGNPMQVLCIGCILHLSQKQTAKTTTMIFSSVRQQAAHFENTQNNSILK